MVARKHRGRRRVNIARKQREVFGRRLEAHIAAGAVKAAGKYRDGVKHVSDLERTERERSERDQNSNRTAADA